MRKKGLAILGSTGSIGESTLEVVRRHPDRFAVVSLAAGNNVARLKEQIVEFKPRFVSINGSARFPAGEGEGFAVAYGADGAIQAATFDGVDTVVAAISGSAGLAPVMAAVRSGRAVALANKEALVMAGPLVMEEARKSGATLMPIDSEHSAIFQSLAGHRKQDLRRIILTASGGPFLNAPLDTLETMTPGQALKHPRWNMGAKVSIDSATMMNKGLEVIEARWLFDVKPEDIKVVIHPQSIVHSMVEYIDGSVISQLSTPDMKLPIAYALAYPERIESGTTPLGMAGLSLDFSEPDHLRFPCLGLAYQALKLGGTASAALNAVDEVAVEMFLKGALPFTGINKLIKRVLDSHDVKAIKSIEDVMEADRVARRESLDAMKFI
ncbi:MAG: 1-deoxy-D-xylulose-5-phosphate reductoisomerase [Deltaproteobacteria bacterium]|nr:1-deoxy-D-xylulose-5-phosphate reductoisomerase [Deltaproteobacteria bacterium]